uniref:BED-type domain-containing protein n=1 Tax=Anopheles funestus TaxID=62324 RepID=A0A182S162_ANOFN
MAQQSNYASPIWNHFTKMEKGAKCKYCLAILSYSKSTTSNLKRHLLSKHRKVPYKKQIHKHYPTTSETPTQEPHTSGAHFDSDSESHIPPPTSSKLSCLQSKMSPETKRQLDRMLLEFITKECLPFSIVENEAFQKFLHTLNSDYKLPSKKSITNALLPSVYNEEIEKVKVNVSSANTIALTTDGWSNINNDSFLALTAHYIDKSLNLQSKLLECSEFPGSQHTGFQIASWINNVVKKFEIEKKVISIVTDDAPSLKVASTDLNIPHIPCFARNLNLIAQNAIRNSIQTTVDEVKHVVMYFKQNIKASHMLVGTQIKHKHETMKLKQDVPNRWNSTFDMMDRFYKNKIPILSCIDRLKVKTKMQNSDWLIIEQSLTALKYFASATKLISAEKQTTLSHVGLLCDVLLRKTSALLSDTNLVPEVKSLISLLVEGMEQRLQVYRDNQQIWKSMFLDPRVKKAGFQNEPEKYKYTCDLILSEMLLLQEKKHTTDTEESFRSSNDATLLYGDIVSQESQNMNTLNELVEDEISVYIKVNTIGVERDPLLWWQENCTKFPTLYTLAMKNLCVPGTSVPCERVFSKAGQILLEKRKRLLPKKLHETLFLQFNC